MGVVQININGPVPKGLAELNHHIRDEHKEIRDGVTGEGQGLSEEDESQMNEDLGDVNDGWVDAIQVQVQAKAVLQRPQQHSQGPLVCWERFLPPRSLKVLLVESDDSTCRVVCALLRNCGYEVIAVENGLQAWKVLEDLTIQIDLVLTEVIMPCLSGIGLLHKIMSHKTCKNVPVIMMSSRDSMSIVFKCLSKGAVNFLVKPIRKNELQNLWQHVWRKSHSSSGSGSESGTMTQKSTKSKSAEKPEDNLGSNDENDIGSIGLNIRDGSDNGSGTQSSWTKRAVEIDTPKSMSPWDQLADPPDSTCAQVIYSWPETFGNTWMPMTPTKAGKKQDGEPENVVMGKDLEIGVPRIPSLQLEDPTEKVLDIISDINKEKLSEINSKKDDEQLEKKQLEHNSDKPNGNVRNQASDLMGVITNSNDSPIESEVFDIPNGLLKESVKKEKAVYENNELPSLELSLKRQREVGDTGTSLHERNVLRHSDQHSAFSRYNSASTANQPPRGNVSSCSPLDNSSEASKRESSQNFQSNTNGTPPSQRSNGSSNNSDTGLTNDSTFTKPMVFSDKTTPKSTVKCLHPSAFRPAQNGRLSLPQPAIQGKADAAMSNTILPQVRGMNQQFQVQHHHHYYHHHHHHVRNMAPQQLAHQDDLLLKNIAVVAPLCSSSNMLSVPIEGNTGNGSTSGSYHGSNGQNGSSSSALTARRSNIESDNGVTMKGGVGDGIGYGSRSGIDKTRFAQREAALIKFRQKRKQRCFEKKVRYQSRKKLAEQRPRVRGQFIRRQAVHENKARTQIVNPSFPL